jgi:subtilisin family serine protease
MLSRLKRLGVALGGLLAALAWSGTAAPATLTQVERAELEAHPFALVLAHEAPPGATRVAHTLPIWRVPGRQAIRVAPKAELVVPDRFIPTSTHFTAGDPLVPQQWWIGSIGATTVEPPGPGKPVTVIDTGADLTHPEFAGRPSTTALNGQSVVGTGEEHGTAVASTIAAVPNGQGIVGVYPQAALQVWDASPSAPGISLSDVLAGLDAAIRRGRGVINLSLGSPYRDPLLEAMITVAYGSGSLVVAASGNDRQRGNPLEYPASFAHVLTVGAIDISGRTAAFSGASQFVDLVAPGQAIPVAIPGTGYSYYTGTSFASPLTAGVAAWVWTARPALGLTQLFDLMRSSPVDMESPGYDPFSGFGRLDIPRALATRPLPPDPYEPNDDVIQIRPNGLFRTPARPLNAPRRLRATLRARLDYSEDPRDVYRVWVAGRRVTTITVAPTADLDLAAWGPQTSSVLESGSSRRRHLKALSEKPGRRGEIVRVRNTSRRGSYHYVEVYTATSNAPGRRVGATSYRLRVSTAPIKARARR